MLAAGSLEHCCRIDTLFFVCCTAHPHLYIHDLCGCCRRHLRPACAMGQPHDRSSKRSAAEAVEEQQEAGETLLEKDKQPADEPGGGNGRRPSGPGQPVGPGARLVVDPGTCQCVCLHPFSGTVGVLSSFMKVQVSLLAVTLGVCFVWQIFSSTSKSSVQRITLYPVAPCLLHKSTAKRRCVGMGLLFIFTPLRL